ncbi:MAG: OmpA family protein [Phycisphaerae bacterium]|nr:OmpA family protein [Phycisphaerae bacterium]
MSMRNRLGKFILPTVVLTAAILSAGCDDVQQLKAANARLSERCETLEGENDRLLMERDRLQSELDGQNVLLEEQKKKVAGLEDANRLLTDGLEQLRAEYRKLANLPRHRLPAKLNTALQEFAAANPNIVEYDVENGMVKFKSDFTFAPGEAAPNAEATAMIAKLVPILDSPEAKDLAVYVAGHTDDMRISRPETRRRHPNNWYLSAHRAVGIQKELAGAGLDPTRICVMGFGEYHPVEPNKPNQKGNAANRRVELWIVPSGSFLTAAAPAAAPETPEAPTSE